MRMKFKLNSMRIFELFLPSMLVIFGCTIFDSPTQSGDTDSKTNNKYTNNSIVGTWKREDRNVVVGAAASLDTSSPKISIPTESINDTTFIITYYTFSQDGHVSTTEFDSALDGSLSLWINSDTSEMDWPSNYYLLDNGYLFFHFDYAEDVKQEWWTKYQISNDSLILNNAGVYVGNSDSLIGKWVMAVNMIYPSSPNPDSTTLTFLDDSTLVYDYVAFYSDNKHVIINYTFKDFGNRFEGYTQSGNVALNYQYEIMNNKLYTFDLVPYKVKTFIREQ